MMAFKICQDSLRPNQKMIEVWEGDIFVAGIYPHERSISVVSKYLSEVIKDEKFPPQAIIKFAIEEGGNRECRQNVT